MRVRIAVPIRDEEEGLPHLLASLASQIGTENLDVRVALLFDGCTDRGADLARAVFADGTLVGQMRIIDRPVRPNAGRARAASAEFALTDLAYHSDAILLTTDADSIPDQNWIERSVTALHEVDVVAGYTRRDRATELSSRDALETYLEQLHHLRRSIDKITYDPAPSHPWVGGANLGMRVPAYRKLGGFRSIDSGEDNDLVDRARHAGLRVRHARDVRVKTSSRTTGRAKGGLADALKHMQSEVSEPRVEHPADAARQYARHATARRAFSNEPSKVDWRKVAKTLGTDVDLGTMARECINAEAFVMKAVPHHPTTRDLPLAHAHKVLSSLTPEQFFEH